MMEDYGPSEGTYLRDSFDADHAWPLGFHLLLSNWSYSASESVSVPMLRQRLWIPYEGTAREDHLAVLSWPVWFRCRETHPAGSIPSMGINVLNGARGRFRLIKEGDEQAPLGGLYSCKLHIWPVGQPSVTTKQIQLWKGRKSGRRPITKSELAKVICRRVDSYLRDHDIVIAGYGRVTSQYIRLVGLTWVSKGSIMPLLQLIPGV
ncbi:uncharacterized protein STEHIDRAFT_121619 [Stereum hirsutum FP-91666 SS1]|uniref:uncharacterized protein n=1 Tax=Stereum hirsutum (strain FP-91666) TaxID=721885 RepID=UPI0004449356|nr:uncharacterized protein STEHIDRAFT_121619 [Stereum hirsutum FP-91666 SS1]EIM86766.1 hypothetical protein STEHIDRAFT_121619 [Stereum hirsutum FP-91666 SS1]